MPSHEKYPEEAEASLRESNESLGRAEDALDEAIARQEAIEIQMDTADDSEQASLSEQHQALDDEIAGLRHDFESEKEHHFQNIDSWGL